MKSLIFLTQRNYGYYNLAQTTKNLPRRTALLTENTLKQFPNEFKSYFTHIYPIKLATGSDLISSYSLDENSVSAAVEKEIKIVGDPKKINFVNSDEFSLLLTGKLRDRYGIPGAGEAQLNLYRDKDLMKKQVAKHNIRVPKHQLLDTNKQELAEYYQQLIASLGNIIVIKPVAGAGSISTHVITSLTEFLDFYPSLRATGLEFEVDEYITGEVFHCDSVIQHGKILHSIASEYLFPNITYPQGKMMTSITLDPNNSLSQRIIDFNQQIIAALGYIDGITHLEVFHTKKDELVFLEIAARLPGGETVPNYAQMTGINFGALDVRIQAGETITARDLTPAIKEYSFAGRIPYRKGKVLALQNPKIKSQITFDWKIKPGDIISHNSLVPMDFCGYFRVTNSNYDQLYEDFVALHDYQPYTVEPLKP